ncbi:MAG: sigma 54-interacting transcriptional regulator [Deltaproteobacteria bacterium]|nr:sigma 54-interacting transcriptional regulator [Deltaproteobacteria bacterium]MBW2661608.1 sigma 54-interacting transcriptional regulator [Deltaproteobacteria bacterium]
MNELTLSAKVVRNSCEGLGLCFSAISQGDILKIWGFIRESITDERNCPYCNCSFKFFPEKCPQCRWHLNFKDKEYFSYWGKESALRRLTNSLSDLTRSDLRKLFQYLEEEVLLKKTLPAEETEEFVGTCQAMKEIFSLIRKVAPTDLPVLILGKSGTGKELTARALYERSSRKDKPFVVVNCAAIPESLIEAALFGYEKGAFTGAYTAKKGKFELAHKGVLFLDEIGELPLGLQPKLLRLLETQMVERIGSTNSMQVDVRIITATNIDIEQAVSEGRFRSDLYHRIKVFTIQLPPLCERGEDKIILAHYILNKIKMERRWNCRGFTPEALDVIREHAWPGNVREMINRIRRAIVIQDKWIRPEDLELKSSQRANNTSRLKNVAKKMRKDLIESALLEHQYNISQTARFLGISRPYVYLLMKNLDIHIPRRGTT